VQVTLTEQDLEDFEQEIADLFLQKRIPFPIHLSGGNERQLVNVFRRNIQPDDWVLCSWRSHYHALLRGVPREEVRQAILDGHSISLCFPKYRMLSSAIVGGTAPIAVGLAWAIKQKRENRKVAVFLGDMSAATGIVHESMEYGRRHALPILWCVENNGLSVQTDTLMAWGPLVEHNAQVIHYGYTNRWPHSGLETFVRF
jgi:TPP-dependent pyruvate/acetoin dehydrogenase alpha subunit